MNIRTKTSLIATGCALPFVLLAALMWITESQKSYMGFGYQVGDSIFYLGAPLTLLQKVYVNHCGYLRASDHWWAIPAMGLLFIAQWIIWGQVIVWIRQRYSRQHPPT
jgi:hypothetical protein